MRDFHCGCGREIKDDGSAPLVDCPGCLTLHWSALHAEMFPGCVGGDGKPCTCLPGRGRIDELNERYARLKNAYRRGDITVSEYYESGVELDKERRMVS